MIEEAIEKLLAQGPATRSGSGQSESGLGALSEVLPAGLLSQTHQAAAEVHQARLRKSAMVGCSRGRGMGCLFAASLLGSPRSLVRGGRGQLESQAQILPSGVPGTHHKDTAGCSTQVARRLGGTGGLVVVGLLAGVEGIIVEGQHQVGIHLTEEPAHLGFKGGLRSLALAVPTPESSKTGLPAFHRLCGQWDLTWSHW